MSNLIFEEARPGDRDAIRAISTITLEEHRARLPDEFPEHDESGTGPWLDFHFEPPRNRSKQFFTRLIVCRDEGAPVGHVLLLFHKTPYGTTRHDLEVSVFDISVHPDHRGRGIGPRLLAEAERVMRAAAATRVRASVWRDNPRSAAMFAANGYDAVNTTFTRRLAPPKAGRAADRGIRGRLPGNGRLYLWAAVAAPLVIAGCLAYMTR